MMERKTTAAEIDTMRRALVPASGVVTFRVEAIEETGGPVAVIHVYDAYDCKGTEAEVSGLLRGANLPWRLVFH